MREYSTCAARALSLGGGGGAGEVGGFAARAAHVVGVCCGR